MEIPRLFTRIDDPLPKKPLIRGLNRSKRGWGASSSLIILKSVKSVVSLVQDFDEQFGGSVGDWTVECEGRETTD
jgi:hypothetical protein